MMILSKEHFCFNIISFIQMAKQKTIPNNKNPVAFLKQIENQQRRNDCFELLEMMKKITNEPPIMWGDSIIGFGRYDYQYKSGHKGYCFLTGFSPRKTSLTIYIMSGFEHYSKILSQLGVYKHSISCLYLKKLDDVDRFLLKILIEKSITQLS